MDLKKVASALGLESEDLTTENAEEKIVLALTANSESHSVMTKKLEELTASNDALKTSLAKHEAKLKGEKPQKQLVALSRKNISMQLDGCVRDAKLTPAARKMFEDRFVSEESVTLSLTSHGNLDDVDKFIEVINANNPVELKEQTGPQGGVELSGHGGDDGSEKAMIEEAKRRKAEAAA